MEMIFHFAARIKHPFYTPDSMGFNIATPEIQNHKKYFLGSP
jgi:hypothetical protein